MAVNFIRSGCGISSATNPSELNFLFGGIMKVLLTCLIFGGVLALSACGKDGGSSPAAAPATAVVTPNGCTADQIPTQAGCGIYSQQCGPNQGLVGTTCQAAIAPTNCGVVAAGQVAPYGCNGYNQAYNGGVYNGYNNGSYYNSGYTGYTTIPAYGGGAYYYNSQTQSFNSNYYSQPVYSQYGYGYRPYYPRHNGVYISGQVSFGF
jgi:hypothetical protein